MKFRSTIVTVLLAAATIASAQTVPLASSHASTVKKPAASNMVTAVPVEVPKPVVKVNGTVLTENDVIREMYTIFPYGRQHNGFPKDMEPEIRRGATDMLIFEELLYQEAKRRNLDVPPERVTKAMTTFRKQFQDKKTYDLYLKLECNGSPAVLKEKIRRSMLIEKMLKTEVEQKSIVTEAAAKAYYEANSKQFEHNEAFQFQTISFIPPDNASQAVRDEAKAKGASAAKLGKEAKDYKAFGVLAEQISEDDWHTKMGDRGPVEVQTLPPSIADTLRKMKEGEVVGPISLGTAWVVVRLEKHTGSGKSTFEESKAKLISNLQKEKSLEIRAELNKKLRKGAKIEML